MLTLKQRNDPLMPPDPEAEGRAMAWIAAQLRPRRT
jgi:hypothetical protein